MTQSWRRTSPERYSKSLANLQRIGTGICMNPEVIRRREVLSFFEKYGLEATRDAFKVSRATLFRWKKELEPKKRIRKTQVTRVIPSAIRLEMIQLLATHPDLGKGRLSILLARFCTEKGIPSPSESTVGRYLSDLRKSGCLKTRTKLKFNGKTGRLTERITQKKPKLRRNGYVPGIPGDLLQIDTVVSFVQGLRRYTVTAIDLKSRFTFAWSYSSLSSRTATDFLTKLEIAAPFAITHIQTDNGLEFHGHFAEALKKTGTIHFYSRPRNPKQNAFIERFNRTIQEEFLYRNFDSLGFNLPEHNKRLMDYLIYYNAVRPHSGIGYKTPLEFLQLTPESQMGWTGTSSTFFGEKVVRRCNLPSPCAPLRKAAGDAGAIHAILYP